MLSNPNPTHPDEIDTNEVRELFLQEYAKHPNVYVITQKMGLRRTTVYNEWMKDELFKKRFDKVRENQVNEIEDNFFDEAVHNKKAIIPQIFILKNWKPERYGDRQDYNLNLNIDLSPNALSTIDKARALMSIEDAQYSIVEPAQIAHSTIPVSIEETTQYKASIEQAEAKAGIDAGTQAQDETDKHS